MKHLPREVPADHAHNQWQGETESQPPPPPPPPSSSSHAVQPKIESLKSKPTIELHRSSSGRNIRLKHSKASALPSPHGLTPRAPAERKRPPELARKRSVSAHDADDDNDESRDRYRSLTPTATITATATTEPAPSPISNQESSVPKPRRSSGVNKDRRSSFMIPEQVLQQLGFVRSLTPELDQADTNQAIDAELEEKASSPPLVQIREEEQPAESPQQQQQQQQTQGHGQGQEPAEKGVYQFDLWKRAGRSRRLVDAIPGYDSAPSPTKPSPPKPSPGKRRSSSADQSADPHQPFPVRHFGASPRASHPSPGRPVFGRQQHHRVDVARQSIGGDGDRGGDGRGDGGSGGGRRTSASAQRVSLTRSTSPIIGGSSRSSLRPFTMPPLASSDDGTIVRWKIGEQIGEGTFGRVYMGLNAETGAQFALKEIEIRAVATDDQMGQLHKLSAEIEVMHSLRHKNIVRYKGSHRTDKHFYIFMEYISGGSIATMLQQFDAFNEEIVRKFTRQIIDGVVYLHEKGIVHRDIKGANVLVTEQGTAKLADFGCSKRLPQIITTSLEESLRSIRGSIPWMAPEVIQQTGHTFKADIWSIGATVIEMASGKHPWPDLTNGLAAMYAIAKTTTSPPIPEDLSDDAKSFLARCFCINPEERATAVELSQHPFLRD